MKNMIPGNTIYNRLPNIMRWLLIYLVATVLLCFFGPITWNIRNPLLVVFYLVCYLVALKIGYDVGFRKKISGNIHSISDVSTRDKLFVHRLLVIGIIFNFMLVIRMANSFDLATILNNIVSGIFSPAEQYHQFHENAALYGSDFFSLLITLGLPFSIASLILSVFYYPKLTKRDKVLTASAFIMHLAGKFIAAANEGIFDTFIYIGVAYYLRTINLSLYMTKAQQTMRNFFVFAAVAVLVVVALFYFTQNILGRTDGNFVLGTLGENYFNANSKILEYIPQSLVVTFVYLSVYLCEGYYGFALSTTLDWVPMYGGGFSSFIRNNISELFNVDLLQYTYQGRIEMVESWGALKNFHTAYTFWANDVGHLGVVFIMLIIGYLFARYYLRSVLFCSKAAIVMMPLLITLVLYLPSNNKIFAQPASFLLVFAILMYDTFKKRKNEVK